MKTLNKLIAASLAALSVGNAVALPDVNDINTRVGNILNKIGVDGAGYSAGDFTINGSNDLGTFSSDFVGADFSGATTAQGIADVLVGLNTDNTTVYVPNSVDSVNTVRGAGLEDMLLNALSFKIDEITGDVGDLVSSYSIGKLAFETSLNNGDAIIAPSNVDYGHADAQSWFGVKNSLDIFTAASDAWVAGIAELNSTSVDGNSHFDADFVVGAEVADYDSNKDAISNVSLTRSTFDSDGNRTLVTVNLGTSYDRDALKAASVALGSTTSSERISILSGETIFGTARHFNDTTGYGAQILSSLDASALTTTTGDAAAGATYVTDGGETIIDNADGTWNVYNSSDTLTGTLTDSQVVYWRDSAWTDTGKFVTITSTNPAYDGWTVKYDTGTGHWVDVVSGGAIGSDTIDSDGVLIDSASVITGTSALFTERLLYTYADAVVGSLVTTINSGALDMIKNSEIKGYAESLLLGTVDTTSPAWLQAL